MVCFSFSFSFMELSFLCGDGFGDGQMNPKARDLPLGRGREATCQSIGVAVAGADFLESEFKFHAFKLAAAAQGRLAGADQAHCVRSGRPLKDDRLDAVNRGGQDGGRPQHAAEGDGIEFPAQLHADLRARRVERDPFAREGKSSHQRRVSEVQVPVRAGDDVSAEVGRDDGPVKPARNGRLPSRIVMMVISLVRGCCADQ